MEKGKALSAITDSVNKLDLNLRSDSNPKRPATTSISTFQSSSASFTTHLSFLLIYIEQV